VKVTAGKKQTKKEEAGHELRNTQGETLQIKGSMILSGGVTGLRRDAPSTVAQKEVYDACQVDLPTEFTTKKEGKWTERTTPSTRENPLRNTKRRGIVLRWRPQNTKLQNILGRTSKRDKK